MRRRLGQDHLSSLGTLTSAHAAYCSSNAANIALGSRASPHTANATWAAFPPINSRRSPGVVNRIAYANHAWVVHVAIDLSRELVIRSGVIWFSTRRCPSPPVATPTASPGAAYSTPVRTNTSAALPQDSRLHD